MTLAIYIHWPFCISKCPYCDFNSHVGDTTDQEIWRQAYRRELEHYADLLRARRVTSIFFGGGTPSLMEARTVESVLQDIARLSVVDPDAEITLEANPSSAEADKFADFRKAGVNRLSLGVQALNDAALRFLGRAHNADEARRAIALAAKHFPRFSFDLIYARQEQTPVEWRQELREALALAGGHLSLYQLTIEPHTGFHTRMRRGETLTAQDNCAADMYEATQEMMDEAGMPAYEISNHARKGHESRHNLTYWHYEDYIGIGPGAHGRIGIQKQKEISPLPPQGGEGWVRGDFGSKNPPLPLTPRGGRGALRRALENHRAPDIWLRQVEERGHGLKTDETLTAETAMREALMMGLRLSAGIDLEIWREKFNAPLSRFLAKEKMARLKREGLIVEDEKNLRASPAGRQRLDAVLAYLV
ncbi:MAG: radical SAM family heme chaperone HemW [Alphaproteobacteria bacterium]|nr:radical SAM family heme chaperone HemW [Alphaproteobacteria bacterium]